MKSRVAITFVLAILLAPAISSAQTDVSLRIRSLGPTFRGLVDDYLTDVYLNPARVAELDGSMAYAARLPRRDVVSPYPVARSYRYDGNRTENQYLGYDVRPLGLSYFGTLGSLALSLGTEVGASSSEDLDEHQDVDTSTDEIYVYQVSNGRTSDTQHYLIDLAVAPVSNALGGRITAVYDSYDYRDGEVRDQTRARLVDIENLWSNYQYRFLGKTAETLVVSAAVGLSLPGRLVRDFVLGGGYREEELAVDHRMNERNDYDADGNGDWFNGNVFYWRRTDTYTSKRKYTGYDIFSRIHLSWSDRIRSAHGGGWSRSTGDGTGLFELDERQFDNLVDYYSANDVEYTYDGVVERVWFESSVGYHEVLFDDVLFAFALHGFFGRTTLDEPASGTASGENSETGQEYTSPYVQAHDNTDDVMRLSMPVGVEWQFHKYATLRLGATFFAGRWETDRYLTRDVYQEDAGASFFFLGALDYRYANMDTNVDVTFSNGLEININDRLILDLQSSYSGTIDLVSYGYISARFLF